MKKDDRATRTFKQGVGAGILGAFIGAPGLGAVIGMAHANKDLWQDKKRKCKR